MGAAVGAALVAAGHEVRWASEGRSPASTLRAEADGLVDVGTPGRLAATSELVVSVCPPNAAVDVARRLGPFEGIYLDANAISPATARHACRIIVEGGGRFVDGGIVGPPPRRPGSTRLYLSGPDAIEVSEAFATPLIETQVVSEWPGVASALKLSYAAWTKGSAALLLTIRAAAVREGVEAWLLDEWRTSLPELAERSTGAARAALDKGWRWDGEMEEIASMLASDGLPAGFHQAAADVFRRVAGHAAADENQPVGTAVEALLTPPEDPAP
jgi:3-hydroxyisobutyrate dehydrogenase-like beta-hydroxyacid dehydrogenase